MRFAMRRLEARLCHPHRHRHPARQRQTPRPRRLLRPLRSRSPLARLPHQPQAARPRYPRERDLRRPRRAPCRLASHLNSSPWQRCQFHLQQNAQAESRRRHPPHLQRRRPPPCRSQARPSSLKPTKKVPPSSQTGPSKTSPKDSPPSVSRKRAASACAPSTRAETLNSQIKRRTRVVGLFPNESSLLRLVTSVLVEISEE